MARWTPIPVAGGAYSDDAKPWSAQDCVNYVPVQSETSGTRSPGMLRGLPGCSTFSDLTTNAPIRGLHNSEGQLLAVSSNKLYRIGNTGSPLFLGTIPGVARVSMAHNQVAGGNEVAIATGDAGYIYNTTTNTLTQIASASFPGAKVFDFLDGYLLFIEPQGRFWGWSDLAAGTSYNTLDRAEAEAQPDKIVTGIVTHREWLVFGERSAEFYRNMGAATGTFQRIDGAEMEVGCASTHGAAKLDNSAFFLGHDGIVYRIEGYQPRRISTHAIEQAISRCDLSQAFTAVYEDRGHKIFYLTFPDGKTWGYDVSMGEWHRRKSEGMDRWRMNALTRWNGKWIGGDYSNGKLYELTWDRQDEANATMERRRTFPALHDNENRVHVNALRLLIDTGQPQLPFEPVTVIGNEWRYTGTFGTQLFDVAYGNGLFVAVGGSNSPTGQIWTTTDGADWTQRTSGVAAWNYRSIAYGGGLFVASRDLNNVLTSSDGLAWTQRTTTNTDAYLVTGYVKGNFIRAGFTTSSEWSANGITWNNVARPSSNDARIFVAHGDVGIFLCSGGAIHRTADGGLTYTSGTVASDPAPTFTFTGGASDGTTIRAFKYASSVLYTYTSTDAGANWTVRQDTVGSSVFQGGKAIYRNNQWVALGATTTGGSQIQLWRSPDGLVPWTAADIQDYTDTTAATMVALTASTARAVLVGNKASGSYAMTSPGTPSISVGATTRNQESTIAIRYSRNGGSTWTNPRNRSMGEVGDFLKGIRISRLGTGRHWVFDTCVTDPVRADLIAASIQIEGES